MTFFFLFLGAILLFVGIQIYIRKRIVEIAPQGSFATNPGRVRPNPFRLRYLTPGLYPHTLSWKKHKEALRIRIFIARQLWHGASNPAVVMQENPLIIAAYALDCDAVLLVRFLPETVDAIKARGIGTRPGTRFLSVNFYFHFGEEWKDDELVLGPRHTRMWRTFRPYIAEFMCGEKAMEGIEKHKREIAPDLWERAKQLGLEKIQDCNLDEVRWGNPMYAEVPRSYLRAIAYAKRWDIPF